MDTILIIRDSVVTCMKGTSDICQLTKEIDKIKSALNDKEA